MKIAFQSPADTAVRLEEKGRADSCRKQLP
jgi:hypothetical protein